MKALKKLLTLVLVLALAAALAAPAFAIRRQLSFFPDADLFDENYKQAAEVMVYHGIIEGDEGGLRPLDTITRAEACKIICFMNLGPDAAHFENEPGYTTFSDVPVDEWYAGYVMCCLRWGIVSGDNGDGTGPFRPNDKITGYEFGKMCLCILGYDSVYEGFETDAWQSEIARLAEEVGTVWALKSDFDWAAYITRQEAFQMAVAAMEKEQVFKLYDNETGLVVGYDEDTRESILWLSYNTEHIVDVIGEEKEQAGLRIHSELTCDEVPLPESEREYFDWVTSAYVEFAEGEDPYFITVKHLFESPIGYRSNAVDPALLAAGQKIYAKNNVTFTVYDETLNEEYAVYIKLFIENRNGFILRIEPAEFCIPGEVDYELESYIFTAVAAYGFDTYIMVVNAEEMEEAGVTFPFEVRMTIRLVDREDPARVFTDSSVTIVVDPASYGHGIG